MSKNILIPNFFYGTKQYLVIFNGMPTMDDMLKDFISPFLTVDSLEVCNFF